jgi:hypothetical protein
MRSCTSSSNGCSRTVSRVPTWSPTSPWTAGNGSPLLACFYPDGRTVDIGSFRGAGSFLNEHLTRNQDRLREGDYLRFYFGTIWISRVPISRLSTR